MDAFTVTRREYGTAPYNKSGLTNADLVTEDGYAIAGWWVVDVNFHTDNGAELTDQVITEVALCLMNASESGVGIAITTPNTVSLVSYEEFEANAVAEVVNWVTNAFVAANTPITIVSIETEPGTGDDVEE